MNILIVRTGGLGDCILTLPVVSYLKDIISGARFSVLGDGNMLAISKLSGLFENFYFIDNAQYSALFSEKKPSPYLRSFFSLFDEVYFFTAGNCREIERMVIEAGAGKCFTLNPKQPEGWSDKHIVLHYLSIVPEFNEQNLADFSSFLPHFSGTDKSGTGLVIHPGSGSVDKNWPTERFCYAADEYMGKVKVVLGPAEIERGYKSYFDMKSIDVEIIETFDELCDVLSGASLYLGNDSGVSHLAAAYGTIGVVLFGTTDPVVWRPPYTTITVINSSDGTMTGISTQEVLDALYSADEK
ncbi:MAG: glycosyltransferase family 9 protein [Candidatus Latescibacteria bacterium]|nr:glycosyltransferase family 9 protein [Candidatus Latescibacterota bacterium]